MAHVTFKTLTEQDKEHVISIYKSDMSHEKKVSLLSEQYGVTTRTIRNWWRYLNLSDASNVDNKQLISAYNRVISPDTQILLVTAAQNKTAVNEEVFDGIKKYCEYINTVLNFKCEIIVIPTKYRNPTSIVETKKMSDDWWSNVVDDYLYYNELHFNDVVINSFERISPTAKRPLSGLEPRVEKNHYIIGHPRMHFKALPRFKGYPLRCLLTTGYVTFKNYSLSKAGGIAKVHHGYGFVVVEKKNDTECYVPRLVKVNSDGTFTDIIYHYNGSSINKITSSLGYIFGDIHCQVLDEDKVKVSNELINIINPKYIVLHDLFDGYTLNPYEKNDYYIRRKKIRYGSYLIKDEIDKCLVFLDNLRQTHSNSTICVIQSNHDDFIDKYINEYNWKLDLHNSDVYLKYAYLQQTVDVEEHGNIFGCILYDKFGDDIKYVKYTDSLEIGSYQCGYHGHHGANGTRGSLTQFTRINTKLIHGHVHTPEICDGVTTVGVSCKLWQYYNSRGMSSWAYADAVIHESGKSQLLVFDDDTYRFSNLI